MNRTRFCVGLFILMLSGTVCSSAAKDILNANDVFKSYDGLKIYPPLPIQYPKEGTIFPPEIMAPTMRWETGQSNADAWAILVQFHGEKTPHLFQSDKPEWTPEDDDWDMIKKFSKEQWASITVLAVKSQEPSTILAKGTTKILTSKDEVGDSILYREVNLPFIEAVKDPSKISWRFGSMALKTQPPVILTGLPVCGNCHSVSRDGKVLGLDVDYANDKGAYAIANVSENIILSRDKIISWNKFKTDEKEKTFGLLSQVSPNGQYVVSTVKDRSIFIPRDDLAYSQLFFPIKGILAVYYRDEGTMKALPGADDKKYVQSNPTWSPDGKYIVFAKSEAFQLKKILDPGAVLLTQAEYEEFNREKPIFRFDLYRIPFNGGRGGTAEPIPGAAEKEYSEYFAKYSPDGKWIVFCRAKSYMLLQPDSELYIIKAEGGTPRRMNCNTERMNSWHSFSSNGRWLVFASKANTPYTQLLLTHIDENGMDSSAVVLEHLTARDRAANIPEFVNLKPGAINNIKEQFLDDQNFMRAALEYRQAADYKGAEAIYRKALELNPNNLQARHDLGVVLFMQNQHEEAIRQFKDILAKDPKFVKAYYNLAVVYEQREEFDEAIKNCREALTIDPRDIDTLNVMAVVLAKQGKLDEATEVFKKVIVEDPNDAPARFNIASVYMKLENWNEALKYFLDADRLAPQNPVIQNWIGAVYAEMERYQEAYEYFIKALALDPNFEDAKKNLEQVKKILKK